MINCVSVVVIAGVCCEEFIGPYPAIRAKFDAQNFQG
jgi:hypothetical protein